MNDTPETFAVILAEMRDLAENRDWHNHTRQSNRECISNLADCIEAAAERERAGTIYAGRNGEMTLDECIVRCDNNSGDNTRGRDVAQIGGWLRELRERRNAPGNAAALRAALEWVADFSSDDYVDDEYSIDGQNLQKAAERARAALSAPARNCDRFATAKDALDAFIREKEIKSADVDNMNLRDFFDWLFAEAEGGAE